MTDLMVVIVIIAISMSGAIGFGWSRSTEDLRNWKARAQIESDRVRVLGRELWEVTKLLCASKAELSELQRRLDEQLARPGPSLPGVGVNKFAKENADLRDQASVLTVRVTELEKSLRESREELVRIAKQRDDAVARAIGAEEMLNGERAAAESLRQRLEALARARRAVDDELQTLRRQLDESQSFVAELTRRIQTAGEGDLRLRQDILGIDGSLARVVFVVDHSSSMRGDPVRWESALRVVRTWIDSLPVEQAAVMWFASTVRRFPEKGGMVDLRGSPLEKAALLAELDGFKSAGSVTSFKQAIDAAFGYAEATAIVIFTDGAPDSPADASISGEPAKVAIPRYVSELRGRRGAGAPRLHVVAVGDYFKRNAAEFLIELAKQGDGTFIGR